MEFRILDLFCGAGGFSYGLDKNANFKTLLGLDFDKNAIKTFNHNIKNAEGIVGDITDHKVRNNIIIKARELGINMIIGGPPCQGFSLKGKQLGLKDDRNFLFIEFFKIVKLIKPEVFVMENVRNILTSSNGYFIKEIEKKFKSLGYIVNYGIINAKNFGIPQNRERALIIGSLSKSIPLPSPNNNEVVTVKDAISDLAYLKSGQGSNVSNYINSPKSKYQKSLRYKKLFNHQSTSHSFLTLKKLKMIPPEGDKKSLPSKLHGKQKFSSTWSRLKWNEISPTIDTRFDTPSNGKNSHPKLHRAITPREAARLQSFDDKFYFIGSKTSVCRQIGNAVPPLISKAIGETIEKIYLKNSIEKDKIKIYFHDAFTFVKELKKRNVLVNHIITDPPYNISKKNNFKSMNNSRRKGINFGKWDYSFDLFGWVKDYVEILDKNGSIIIFSSYLFLSHIIDKLKSCNIFVKDILVWQKSNPMPRNVERRYVQDMEFAIWAVKKDSKWVFNKPKNLPYVRSLFKTSLVSGKEKTKHPTQKSLKLMKEIIEIHTNKNDLIIDPFMGSGTTGVAALELKRRFIGIENNHKYFRIAVNRLSNLEKGN